jgi:hypothetical protein
MSSLIAAVMRSKSSSRYAVSTGKRMTAASAATIEAVLPRKLVAIDWTEPSNTGVTFASWSSSAFTASAPVAGTSIPRSCSHGPTVSIARFTATGSCEISATRSRTTAGSTKNTSSAPSSSAKISRPITPTPRGTRSASTRSASGSSTYARKIARMMGESTPRSAYSMPATNSAQPIKSQKRLLPVAACTAGL